MCSPDSLNDNNQEGNDKDNVDVTANGFSKCRYVLVYEKEQRGSNVNDKHRND